MRFPAFSILAMLAAAPIARALDVPADCEYLIVDSRKAAKGYRLVVDGGSIRFVEAGPAGRRVDLKGAQAE